MSRPPRTAAELRSYIKTCWTLLVVSVLAVGYAGYSYVYQREFVAHATHVQGRIVGNVHTTSKGSDHFRAIFKFTDQSGRLWEVRDRKSRYSLESILPGQPCTVLYDPADPAAAQLETVDTHTVFDMLGVAVVPGGTGIIIGAIALWALRQHYATLRQLRAAGGDGLPPRDPAILAGP